MTDIQNLLNNNRNWSARMRQDDPAFFQSLVGQQNPEYLWIGCSDSRVPANQIIGLMPGEVFVHRNVANLVVHSDLNCLSVIQFAVEVLKVKHIIVCGHYGCGGVKAALERQKLGLIDNWLRHIQDIHEMHRAAFEKLEKEKRWDKLCELNVISQVLHVAETTIVQDAWNRGQNLTVHGLIYALHDGLLRDLGVSISTPQDVEMKHKKSLEKILL